MYRAQNLDYEATYEKLCGVFPGVNKTQKGLISFYLSQKKIAVLISPKGNVQVAWESVEEKENFLPIIEKCLVGDGGQKVVLSPLKSNVNNIPYPPPENFSIAWCAQSFIYGVDAVRDDDELAALQAAIKLSSLPENKPMARLQPTLKVPMYVEKLLEHVRGKKKEYPSNLGKQQKKKGKV